MGPLPDWLIVPALFVLRLLVPLAITLAIGYGLARLDAKWQAGEQARRAETPPAVLRPCWEQKGCSAAARANCPAFQSPGVACWNAYRRTTGRIPDACFSCDVFLKA